MLTLAEADAPTCPPLDVDRSALFLDLDGTLVGLAPRPDDVRPEPALTRLLRALARRLDRRLAVVSGRTVADLDRVLDGAVATVAGVHGLERRTPAGLWCAQPAAGLSAALEALHDFARQDAGLLVEDKGLGATVHYRRARAYGPAARSLAAELAERHGLALQLGDMVAELKTPGADKGVAVRSIMTEPPFAGRLPVFVGDDLTDEHGFEAARALGGHGVLVASDRSTVARDRLPDVAAVRAWLQAALA